jgi:hypothetical protein
MYLFFYEKTQNFKFLITKPLTAQKKYRKIIYISVDRHYTFFVRTSARKIRI